MADELTALGGRKAAVDFSQEPFVIINQPFYRLFYRRFGGAALLSGHAGKLSSQIGVEVYFHASVEDLGAPLSKAPVA